MCQVGWVRSPAKQMSEAVDGMSGPHFEPLVVEIIFLQTDTHDKRPGPLIPRDLEGWERARTQTKRNRKKP